MKSNIKLEELQLAREEDLNIGIQNLELKPDRIEKGVRKGQEVKILIVGHVGSRRFGRSMAAALVSELIKQSIPFEERDVQCDKIGGLSAGPILVDDFDNIDISPCAPKKTQITYGPQLNVKKGKKKRW